jgi:hypothetical protein
MQARGRSPADIHRSHINRMLWRRAIKCEFVWRRALRASALLTASQALLLGAMRASTAWLLLLIPLATLVAALLASAGVFVHMNIGEIELSRN